MDTLAALLSEIPKFSAILNIVILWFVLRTYNESLKTNGRLIRLESWQGAHEKQDDERFHTLHDAVKEKA